MKLTFIMVGIVAGLFVLTVIIGLLLPRGHIAARTARFKRPLLEVWQAITDHENEPSWRTDLKSKKRVADIHGHPVWLEVHQRGDNLTLETVLSQPPRDGRARFVGRIADDKLPFSGTWTYELKSEGDDACTVTITEDGEVHNPVFRFIAYFIMSNTSTIEKYLKMLAARCGHAVEFVETVET